MTLFQLILLFIAVALMVIFFRQVLSGNYPKRGIDYEANIPKDKIDTKKNETIITNKNLLSDEESRQNRLKQLIDIAKESIEKGDNIEAKKALLSALYYGEDNLEVLKLLAKVYNNMNDFIDAKDTYMKILQMNPNDASIHLEFANVLHRLGEDEEALIEYKKALELNPNLKEAQTMIEELNR